MSYLGLDRKEPIRVDNADVIPLNVVVTTMPKPAELAGKIHGYSCVGANVKGTKGDKNVELFVYTIANHDEIYQKSGFQATVWQTGYVSSFSRQGLNIGYSKTLFLYTFGYHALLARCNFQKRCDISV
ncbi:hypothetical protein [Heyndrickxia coagulans]|uniref:Uncharacterized protein n=1 Tax=Heyndrickxia coagulans TaxID=1398 RepID=A0AAW7CF97_HEYCO|nr:hypothetical protein [Heyndrickxia coagulans]MDL5041908.1 hypothetical protein [Heyndrickxia coagulans]